MSEMVDRVAEALWRVSAEPRHDGTWEALAEPWKENCRTHARAAIAAMREPHKCVLKAMSKAMSPEHRPTPDRVGVAEKHRIRWRAAIDRVLSDVVE